MIFILGGKGFLGSALVRYCEARGWEHVAIDQQEYPVLAGGSCDLLINANGNSRKFLAREAPLEDFDLNVRSVRKTLEDFRFGMYVYFSSADVYPDSSFPATTLEDAPIDTACQSPYGFHKYLGEQCVRFKAPEWLILRLSGFVGPGLRKNPIHDLLAGEPLWVSADSEFQYMHTQDLARIVFELALDRGARREVINVGGEGVISVEQAARMAGKQLTARPGSPRVRCELSLWRLAGYCTVPGTSDTVRDFVRSPGEL